MNIVLSRIQIILAIILVYLLGSLLALTACDQKSISLRLVQEYVIPEIAKNLSGLTWNAETNTLFAVTNEPTLLFELNTQGRILRQVVLDGFKDTEGITHIEGTYFAVVEERRGTVCIINLPAQAESIAHESAWCLELDAASPRNKGFEGISYDPATRTIFTVRESRPFQCIAIPLDAHYNPGQPIIVPLPDAPVRDIASIIRDPDGSLWILSEASARILHLGPDGQILKTYRLPSNTRRIQAEGITRTPDGRLFVVGEPNIFVEYAEK